MTSQTAKQKLVHTLAVFAALATSVALAQVRQVQLGNPMDANPGVGTGGSNAPITGYVPINGNEIVTGNVAGLKYFHGAVGTSSPYTFQSTLGSSSLNNFARQSAGGVTNSGALNQIFYLPSATVSTAAGHLYSAPVGGGFDSLLVPRASVSPIATSSQIQSVAPLAQGRAYDRGLPVIPLQPGAPGTLLSSPIFAARLSGMPSDSQNRVDQVQPPTAPGQGGPEVPSDQFTPSNNNNDTNASSKLPDSRIKSQSPDYVAEGKQAKSTDMRIGGSYASLLDQFSKIEAPTGPGVDPRSSSTGSGASRGGSDSNAQSDVDPLTGQLRQMLARSATANATPSGNVGPSGNGGGTGATRLGQPPRPGQDLSPTAKRLQDLSTDTLTAGSKIKPVKTLASPAPTGAVSPFEVLMTRGQGMLKEGRYLEASLAFQNALATHPDDALAIIGWAHADIGAGFYSTATTNLKFTYTRKPEMISVKYDANAFIPATRVQFVMNDLEKLTTSKEQGNLASFLYCYLAYQTGHTDLLQAELKKWGDRPTHDEWQTVVSRAWNSPVSAQTKPAEDK